MSDYKFPTEVVDLPSKGWFYPPDHPLASGQVDIFHMAAKHEDILTSANLIMKGVVIDKLLEALIATQVKYQDLLIGDKYGIMVAARILGYGKDYEATVECPQCNTSEDYPINLTELKDKEITFLPEQKGKNEFTFVLPITKKTLTFKLLTQGDDQLIRKELDNMKKLKGETSYEITTRMRSSILSVDGDRDRMMIGEFVNNMPVKDAKAFRDHARKIMPDVDLSFDFECKKCGHEDRLEVPIDYKFFWPDAKL
jgi:hypothetical protein